MNRNIETSRYLRVLHWLAALILTLISFVVFQGCAKSVRTVYQDVYIPVSCNISMPNRPKAQKETVFMVMELTEYTRKLEISLRACISPDGRAQ
jgi:hypothetical protein